MIKKLLKKLFFLQWLLTEKLYKLHEENYELTHQINELKRERLYLELEILDHKEEIKTKEHAQQKLENAYLKLMSYKVNEQ